MIIGFSGKMEAGKDTAAAMLSYILLDMKRFRTSYFDYVSWSKEHEPKYITPFAKSLKRMVSILLHCEEKKLYDQPFKKQEIEWLEGSPTVRKILQNVGNALREKIDPGIWVKILFNRIQYQPHVFISDVRYKNEADAIKAKGGIIIRINRPGEHDNSHISETDLDDYDKFDYVVENDRSLEWLFIQMKKIAEDLQYDE